MALIISPSGTGTVTGVTGTAPVVSSGGTAPAISMAAATTSVAGYLTAADWTTFNGKQAALGFTPYNSTNPSGYIASGAGSFASGGLVEIGRYIDFHGGTGAATDYDVRLDCGPGTGTTGAGTLTIQASGGLVNTGNITAYSDERLKHNWSDLPLDYVTQLSKIKHGTYDRIDTGIRQVGVSAQSLQLLLPEAVVTCEDGMLSVAYGNAAMVSAVELAKRVVELETKLQKLENLVSKLIEV